MACLIGLLQHLRDPHLQTRRLLLLKVLRYIDHQQEARWVQSLCLTFVVAGGYRHHLHRPNGTCFSTRARSNSGMGPIFSSLLVDGGIDRNQLRCTHCRKFWHTKETCYQLVGYLEGWKPNRRSGLKEDLQAQELAEIKSNQTIGTGAKALLNEGGGVESAAAGEKNPRIVVTGLGISFFKKT